MTTPASSPSPKPRWKEIGNLVVNAAIVMACLAITWSVLRPAESRAGTGIPGPASRVGAAARPNAPPGGRTFVPTELQPIDDATIIGNKGAPVAIIEYSDYECPYCGQFARNTWPEIRKQYVDTGKVVLAFRHLPLDSIHPKARRAAEAAECAREQSPAAFEPVSNRLFQNPKALEEADLTRIVSEAGLDGARFATCLQQGQMRDRVRSHAESAAKIGVSGTPTFFLGALVPGKGVKVTARLSGASSFERFQSQLDRLLATAAGRSGQGPPQ